MNIRGIETKTHFTRPEGGREKSALGEDESQKYRNVR